MGRRSSFKRVSKDLYRTFDLRAVPPLLPFLKAERIGSFIEPCYGYGDLVGPLLRAGLECRGRYDVSTWSTRTVDPVIVKDARTLEFADLNGADAIITNPPWARHLLRGMIIRFATLAPTWLLFDSNWKQTDQAVNLARLFMTDYVPVPRLQWIKFTDDTAKDDCGWYRFDVRKDQSRGIRFWTLGETPQVSDQINKGKIRFVHSYRHAQPDRKVT